MKTYQIRLALLFALLLLLIVRAGSASNDNTAAVAETWGTEVTDDRHQSAKSPAALAGSLTGSSSPSMPQSEGIRRQVVPAGGNRGTSGDGIYVLTGSAGQTSVGRGWRSRWNLGSGFWPGYRIPTGACCMIDGSCAILSQNYCETQGGIYQGDETTCDPSPCIPILILQDGANPPQPIANADVDLYRNGTFLLTVATDGQGEVGLPGAFQPGDQIRAQMVIHTESVPKRPSGPVADMYTIEVDNGKFDVVTGDLSYDAITGVNQTLVLDHTTVAFDLLVSIQWEAGMTYMSGLAEGLRQTCNYLYDISDGQMRIRHVEIFDNADNIGVADVVIVTDVFSSYAQGGGERYGKWPYKPHLPPKWFGSYASTIDGLVQQEPLDFLDPWDVGLKAYALGHYALRFGSEHSSNIWNLYNDFSTLHNPIHGFMENPFPGQEPRASEMSRSAVEYAPVPGQNTDQWYRYGLGCIDLFEQDFEGDYGGVFAQIFRPDERGVDQFTGPNENLSAPDYDCGANINVVYNDVSDGGKVVLVTALGPTGSPLVKGRVVVYSSGHPIVLWGWTDGNGQVRIRGARSGDFVYVYGGWYYYVPRLPVHYPKSDGDYTWYCGWAEVPGDDSPVSLQAHQVAGDFPFIQSAELTPAGVDYQIAVSSPLPDNLSLSLHPDSGPSQSVVMIYNGSDMYNGSFLNDPGQAGFFLIETVDDSGEVFAVMSSYVNSEFSDSISDGEAFGIIGPASLQLDSSIAAGKSLLLMSSDYPPLRDSLPVDVMQVGPAISVSLFGIVDLPGADTLRMYYDDTVFNSGTVDNREGNLGIWYWNLTHEGWEKVADCAVDTTANCVIAEIAKTGIYAAFAGTGCCIGITGNIDNDPAEFIDLGDLTRLIDYLFISFEEPECLEEANVDGDGGGLVDLGDLTRLIDYLFISFTPPAACQ